MLIDKNMKKMDLLETIEMSPNTLAKLGRNEDVSMDVLKRICTYLQCDIGDIMEMIPEDENGH
jgi:DNA-binding Xre family transcriptional regulator